jgi:hypothetical protein
MNYKKQLLTIIFLSHTTFVLAMTPKPLVWNEVLTKSTDLILFQHKLPPRKKNIIHIENSSTLQNLALFTNEEVKFPKNVPFKQGKYRLIAQQTFREDTAKRGFQHDHQLIFVAEKENFLWRKIFAYRIDSDCNLKTLTEPEVLSERRTLKKTNTALFVGACITAYYFRNYIPEAVSLSSLWGLFGKK